MLRTNSFCILLVLFTFLLSACQPVILPVPIPVVPTAITPSSNTADLQSVPLLNIVIDLGNPRDIGSGDLGIRYVSDFAGGTVDSKKLQGDVLADGTIWYLIRRDCIAEIILQGVLQTNDGAHIEFTSRGFTSVGPTAMKLVVQGQLVNPADALFRGVTFFTTDSLRYEWVNHATTITTYQYNLDQLQFMVYELHP